jgi:putative transcriptional regulator
MKGSKDYERMSVFEQVMEALEEGVAHARGELTLKTTIVPAPAPRLSSKRVRAIRKKTGQSQAVFASFLNVPKRTLESWEQGRRTPKAGEARLLQIVEAAPKEFEALVFAVGKESVKRKRRKRSAVA